MKRVLFLSYLVILMMLCACSQKNITTENSVQTSGGFLAVPVCIKSIRVTDLQLTFEGIHYPEKGGIASKFRLLIFPGKYLDDFAFSTRLQAGLYQIQRFYFFDKSRQITSLHNGEENLLAGGNYSFNIKNNEVTMLLKILMVTDSIQNKKWMSKWWWIKGFNGGRDIEYVRKMLDIETQSDYWSHQLAKDNKYAENEAPHVVSDHSGLVSYSNNTVVDITNKLMWAAHDNGYDIDWNTAYKYCENYKLGGFENWRIPSEQELSILFKKGIKYEKDSDDFIRISDMFIWTSKKIGAVGAQLFNQKTGNTVIFSPNDLKRNRVLPVRDMAQGETAPKIWTSRQVAFHRNVVREKSPTSIP